MQIWSYEGEIEFRNGTHAQYNYYIGHFFISTILLYLGSLNWETNQPVFVCRVDIEFSGEWNPL